MAFLLCFAFFLHCCKLPKSYVFCSVASAPTDLTAVQEGPTSIRVSWSPPSPLGDTTGYRIDYTSSDGSSDSVTVSDGSTDNHLLTGLQNGDTYTISIVATTEHFFSEYSPSAQVVVGEPYKILVPVYMPHT